MVRGVAGALAPLLTSNLTGFGRFEPVPIERGGTRAGRLRFCPGHHPCFGARRGYNPWGTFEIVKLPRQ
jgi:hypothetical protein